MILTATEVTLYSNISASAATIEAENLIPVVQERIVLMLNNYFLTDLEVTSTVTFNATARTIVAQSSFEEFGFLASDEIRVYNSYRNDGYFTVASVSTTTLTLTSACSVVDELSGRTVILNVVRWPLEVKVAAAKMIAYDYDKRDAVTPGLTSRSLGPLSESYAGSSDDECGYPRRLTSPLDKYRIARSF